MDGAYCWTEKLIRSAGIQIHQFQERLCYMLDHSHLHLSRMDHPAGHNLGHTANYKVEDHHIEENHTEGLAVYIPVLTLFRLLPCKL